MSKNKPHGGKYIQEIRIADVLFIAPVLIVTGIIYKLLPMPLRILLIFIGLATLVYNTKGFINHLKETK